MPQEESSSFDLQKFFLRGLLSQIKQLLDRTFLYRFFWYVKNTEGMFPRCGFEDGKKSGFSNWVLAPLKVVLLRRFFLWK